MQPAKLCCLPPYCVGVCDPHVLLMQKQRLVAIQVVILIDSDSAADSLFAQAVLPVACGHSISAMMIKEPQPLVPSHGGVQDKSYTMP